MPRRDDSGRFVSDDDDDRYGRSFGSRGRSREYDDWDDDRRGSSRRGFASMDPERQREISSMGGRASHGGQGRDWEDDERYGRSNFGGSRGRARESDWEDDYEDRRGMSGRADFRGDDREYGTARSDYGTGRSTRGQSRDWEDDDRDRDRFGRFTSGGGNRGRSQQFNDYDDDDDRRGSSRRGFASMDPERQREIASMGGRASHGGRGREDDDDRDRDRSGRFTSGSGRGRSRYEDDDDDRGRSSSRRGFASMDPEEHRRISRMGGHASHGGR